MTPTVSELKVEKSGKDVTLAQRINLSGGWLKAMDLKDNDSLQLTVTNVLDVDGLAKLIDKEIGNDKGPGAGKRIAEALATEAIKQVIIQGAVHAGKLLS